jgi:hypothetical protein
MNGQREVKVWHGSAARAPHLLLANLLRTGPALVWAESPPGPRRRDDFPGLWTGAEASRRAWPEALEEVRLFWPAALVHLLARDNGTQWAAFDDPAGPPGARLPAATLSALQAGQPQTLPLERGEQAVLTRRDFERYFRGGRHPDTSRLPRELRLIEYRRASDLIWWTLAEGKA